MKPNKKEGGRKRGSGGLQLSRSTPGPTERMVSLMILITASGLLRRAAVGRGGNPVLFASAFSSTTPQTTSLPRHAFPRASQTARFMSTDAPPAREKTEEEKAAIKAAREARK